MDILRLGSTGPQVELLQAALGRPGYYKGIPDGIFDSDTEQAVRTFQQSYGLAVDGIVGPATYTALRPFLVGYVDYTVQPGDSLFVISRKYGSNVQAIATANPDINPEMIFPGQELTIPLGFPVTFTNISFTSEVLELYLEGMKKRYPFLVVGQIGQSVLGKPLYSIAIGEGENEVGYNASHHANEWITTTVLAKFLEDYARSYALGENIFGVPASDIYARTTIHMIPMVNPDGVDLVTGAIPSGNEAYNQALSMNYLQLNFPSGWKANILGVDLNLNYPAEWRTAREIKYSQGYVRPGPRDFVGPTPLSEPESQAMALFTLQHHFRLTLSFHTQGQVIYWKFLDYLPPQSLDIARTFSAVSGYLVEETPYASGFAGYKDWFIQTYNLPGYTIEAGLGENPLPVSQFGQIYNDNIGILTYGALV